MGTDSAWTRWIDGLRQGDDLVVGEFCETYARELERVADRRIAPFLRRRVGPESVAQSACWSFLRRAREGQFQLESSESLWRLLCAMTLRKVREKARFHGRERRAVGREAALSAGEAGAAPGPTPDEAAEIADAFEALLGSLDEETRDVVEAKLDERSNAEIAEARGCSERTVRRLLAELRGRLERALEVA